jgi:hypothetical protein
MTWYSKILDAIKILSGFSVEENNPINKFGEQLDVDQADVTAGITGSNLGQVIWPVKAGTQVFKFLDSPKTVTVKSTSANDGVGGSGAYVVTFIYLDANGEEKETDISLNGLTPIAFPETILGCFRAKVKTPGIVADGQSAINDGDITLNDSSTGDIYCIIPADQGQTLTAVQRIPAGKKGKIVSHYLKFAKQANNQGCNVNLYIRKSNGAFQIKYNGAINTDRLIDEKTYKVGGISVEAGDTIFWSCVLASADNIPIQAGFDIVLEDNA